MTVLSDHALPEGQPFATVNGRRGQVGELLGSGGQGEVYAVSLAGTAFALKWYHPHYIEADEDLRVRLERAVRRGAPTEDFLWPLDLAEVPGRSGFGYIMPLRQPNYTSIQDIIAPPPRRLDLSLPTRADVCMRLANNFLELHASGFCYQDINFGNIFLDPDSARILICDNDNVNIDGADASIYGTRKFMAPEVVRREMLPNSRTDLFSMAVLFFYTFFGWHPLDGRREQEVRVMNAAAENRLYGTEPLFLFDPNNDENGPVEGDHDWLVARWNSLPDKLKALFVRAFTIGLHDPAARVLETEWRGPLGMIATATVGCPDCGFEHVIDCRDATPVATEKCLCCGEPMVFPLVISSGDSLTTLGLGRELSLATSVSANGDDPMARVEPHPKHPDLLGLRNLSEESWRVAFDDGSAHRVDPGKAVRIAPGVTIETMHGIARMETVCTVLSELAT